MKILKNMTNQSLWIFWRALTWWIVHWSNRLGWKYGESTIVGNLGTQRSNSEAWNKAPHVPSTNLLGGIQSALSGALVYRWNTMDLLSTSCMAWIAIRLHAFKGHICEFDFPCKEALYPREKYNFSWKSLLVCECRQKEIVVSLWYEESGASPWLGIPTSTLLEKKLIDSKLNSLFPEALVIIGPVATLTQSGTRSVIVWSSVTRYGNSPRAHCQAPQSLFSSNSLMGVLSGFWYVYNWCFPSLRYIKQD